VVACGAVVAVMLRIDYPNRDMVGATGGLSSTG